MCGEKLQWDKDVQPLLDRFHALDADGSESLNREDLAFMIAEAQKAEAQKSVEMNSAHHADFDSSKRTPRGRWQTAGAAVSKTGRRDRWSGRGLVAMATGCLQRVFGRESLASSVAPTVEVQPVATRSRVEPEKIEEPAAASEEQVER